MSEANQKEKETVTNTQMKELTEVILNLKDAICKPRVPFITPGGCEVGDVTEGLCYVAEGLYAIAEAIGELADAVSEK